MLRKGATFTLPTNADTPTLCKVRGINTTQRCGDFCPDTCCYDLAVESEVITLRGKSDRRTIVYLILV